MILIKQYKQLPAIIPLPIIIEPDVKVKQSNPFIRIQSNRGRDNTVKYVLYYPLTMMRIKVNLNSQQQLTRWNFNEL